MRIEASQPQGLFSAEARVRRPRPDHPEDFGRGPFWRLAELFFLGFIFPSPPPAPRIRIEDDDEN
jgi:hypothetical protein